MNQVNDGSLDTSFSEETAQVSTYEENAKLVNIIEMMEVKSERDSTSSEQEEPKVEYDESRECLKESADTVEENEKDDGEHEEDGWVEERDLKEALDITSAEHFFTIENGALNPSCDVTSNLDNESEDDDDIMLRYATKRSRVTSPKKEDNALSSCSINGHQPCAKNGHQPCAKNGHLSPSFLSNFSESNESSSKITLSVSKNTKNKRFHDKIFACYFCSKLYTNMRIHYLRRHPKEKEVLEIQQYSIGSPERSNLLMLLRNIGNFKHNIRVLKDNEGILLMNRRPNRKYERQNYKDYIPCKYCYGFFFKYDLKKHAGSCVFNKTDITKHILVEGTLLLYEVISEFPSTDNIHNLLSDIKDDPLFQIISKDYLITRFGNFLADCGYVPASEITQKMKYLGRLLVFLQENHSSNSGLSDFFVSKYFESILNSALRLKSTINDSDSRRFADKIIHSIRLCCNIKIGMAIKENNMEEKRESQLFLENYMKDWKEKIRTAIVGGNDDDKSCPANSSENLQKKRPIEEPLLIESRKKHKKCSAADNVINSLEVSLAKDLTVLCKFLDKYINERREVLQKDPCLENWLELTQACLCKIVIFNKRRGDDMTKMLLSSYNSKDNWSLSESDEAYKSLTLLEKTICRRYDVIQIKGRRDKFIPVTVPPDTKISLDLLTTMREECGIPKQNQYLFSTATNNGYYRSWNIINRFGRQCNLNKIHLLTNTNLRKFISTCSQILSLNMQELMEVSEQLDLNLDQHLNILDSPLELTRVCDIFITTEISCTNLSQEGELEDHFTKDEENSKASQYSDDTTFMLSSEKMKTSGDQQGLNECDQSENLEMNVPEVELKEEPETSFVLEASNFLEDDTETDIKSSCHQYYEGESFSEGGSNHMASSENYNHQPCSFSFVPLDQQSSRSRITLALSKNTKDKRFHDKVFACYYCSKLLTNMRIHYLRRHPEEKEVREIQQYPVGRPERGTLLFRLRNLGNFKHNVDVIKKNEGILLINRRPNRKCDRQNYMNYVPCKYCYGFFYKYDLTNHCKSCTFNKDKDCKHIISEGTLLLYEATSDLPSQNILDILSFMDRDEVFDVLCNDYLIMRFGNYMVDNEKEVDYEIIQKMRDLANLLMRLREENNVPHFSLKDFFVTSYFDAIVSCVLNFANHPDCKNPCSLVRELGHSIRCCSGIKVGISFKENNDQIKIEAEEFVKLFKTEWKDRVESFVLEDGVNHMFPDEENIFLEDFFTDKRKTSVTKSRARGLKDFVLTDKVVDSLKIILTRDLGILNQFLIDYIQVKKDQLEKDTCLENWLELTQACLCRIVIFNKRRGDEMTKMLLSSYSCQGNWSLSEGDDSYKSLTILERMLVQKI
ncbi:hypothetical protein Avbf_01616 [Armadillidium vulgare]|nr:hypothetical protein Avbf_01616 [Armadillidium vulgare]